jgi:hypothetical protein
MFGWLNDSRNRRDIKKCHEFIESTVKTLIKCITMIQRARNTIFYNFLNLIEKNYNSYNEGFNDQCNNVSVSKHVYGMDLKCQDCVVKVVKSIRFVRNMDSDEFEINCLSETLQIFEDPNKFWFKSSSDKFQHLIYVLDVLDSLIPQEENMIKYAKDGLNKMVKIDNSVKGLNALIYS